MRGWNNAELERIGALDEMTVAVERSDGTLGNPRIVWMVRVGDEVFVRSARGKEGNWYKAAMKTHLGHISVAGSECDVHLEDAAGYLNEEIDRAFWDKYRKYPAQYVEAVANEAAHAVTVRIRPR